LGGVAPPTGGRGGDEPRPHARPRLSPSPPHRACQVCDFVAAVGVTAQPEAVTMLHNAAGEAFITLESKSQETEVLKANRQQVGKRYPEPERNPAPEPNPDPDPNPDPNSDPDPDPDPNPNQVGKRYVEVFSSSATEKQATAPDSP